MVLTFSLSKQNAVPEGLGSAHHSVWYWRAMRAASPRKLSNSRPTARTSTECPISPSRL